MNADNLYPVDVLRDLIALQNPGLPTFERDDLVRTSNIPPDRIASFALIETDARSLLRRIVEKPGADAVAAAGPHALVSMNCWKLDGRIFDACRAVAPSVRGELELPQAVQIAVDTGVPFATVPGHGPVLDLSQRSDLAEVVRRLSGETPSP